ncbi:MAG TPA: winged helix-turn-helix transcriptional regulator, partial [Candidatus Thermoplasmatota archaeon]
LLRGEQDTRYYPVSSYVDLGTRHTLRDEVRAQWDEIQFDLWSDLGPRLEVAFFARADPMDVLFQNRPFQVGDDLTATTEGFFRDQWGLWEEGISLRGYTARVERWGTLDGRQVLGVRFAGQVVANLIPDQSWDYWWGFAEDYNLTFLGLQAPMVTDFTFERMAWLDADSPYPVLYEDSIQNQSGLDRQAQTFLRGLQRGSRPIHWGDDVEVPHYSLNTALPRSGMGARHPADGSPSPFRFPLATALDTAEALPHLQAWKMTNADARFTGATLNSCFLDECDPTRDSWHLVWATPQSEAFHVNVVKDVGQNAQVLRASPSDLFVRPGDDRNHIYSDEDLPRNPATAAAVAELWALLAPPNELKSELRSFHWGFGMGRLGWFQDVPPVETVYMPFASGRTSLQWMSFGHAQEETTPDTIGSPGASALAVRSGHESGLSMNVTSGELYPFTYWVNYKEYNPLPSAPLPLTSQVSARHVSEANAPARSPVEVLGIGAASVGLLGLLIGAVVAYFQPLARFASSQLFLGLPFYAKLRKSELTNNKFRDDLVSLIRSEPGISPPQLHRAVGGGWSTVVYHLTVLEKNNLVSSLIDGRHKRFFPVGDVDHGKRGQIAALRNPRTKEMLDLIMEEPGVVQKELAQRLHVTVPTAIWHVRRLEQAGLIESQRRDRKVHYYIHDERVRSYDAKSAVEVA